MVIGIQSADYQYLFVLIPLRPVLIIKLRNSCLRGSREISTRFRRQVVLQCCRAHLQRLLYIAVAHTCFPDAIWHSVNEQ